MYMISYRCTANNINSIDSFINARSSAVAGVKEVCFARILGAVPGIESKITEIDNKMGIEMQNGSLDYYRLSNLPKLIKPEDVVFYTSLYDRYKSRQTMLSFRKLNVSSGLANVLFAAIDNVSSVYMREKSSVTDSILKNFIVKIMFWLDEIGSELFSKWSENRCIKLIAENISKEQEYLFFYVITQMGCDVLLLESEKDVETVDALKGLSAVLSSYPFRKVELPEYKKYVPVQTIMPVVSSAVPATSSTPRTPMTASVSNMPVTPAGTSAISLARPASYKGGSTTTHERRELNYEELAQLASSIVMITVQNRDGEVECTGLGIMISSKGYILTNCHVVSDGSVYLVRIEDDDNIYGSDELIKYNQQRDLAIIRINRQCRPLPIYRGPQKLVRGQKVVAIGSPLGLFNSVSDGIISGFRNIRNEDMIQFTAPISSGSSGGAVLNMYGEVIGISTAGIDGGQNINLAMSYESILDFAGGFIE